MSYPLYNIALHAYAAAARVAAAGSDKVAEMCRGQRESLQSLDELRRRVAPEGFDYWFHAASLGEFEQARPVIEALRLKYPHTKVLLSFFSPSGYRVRHNWPGADAVVYLPFDTPRRVKAFLDAARPHHAIFVKYEFWANYLGELHRRGIPVWLISAIFRPEQRFFKSWGGFWRNVLGCFDRMFVQDDDSRRLLDGVGLGERTTVAGDTRFDRVAQIRAAAREILEVESFVADCPFTLVAGSSWEADEDKYIPWLLEHPQVKAIIAPHEFDSQRLELLRRRLGADHTVLLSECSGGVPAAARYLIVDCFGLLSSIYRYGQAALIGGGFGAGIHNINEAAVYGIPVLFGPNNHKFREAAELQACGGGFCYTDRTTLSNILNNILTDPAALAVAGKAAGSYISSHTGATEKIMHYL